VFYFQVTKNLFFLIGNKTFIQKNLNIMFMMVNILIKKKYSRFKNLI